MQDNFTCEPEEIPPAKIPEYVPWVLPKEPDYWIREDLKHE